MATTTPNYGWDVPTSTDYVKDGATAIETLGDDIDATLWTALGGAYPGLRLIKKQTIGSGVSSVTVTGAFSATYENYRIIISKVDASEADSTLYLKLGGSTGSTYFSAVKWVPYNSGTMSGTQNTSSSAGMFIGLTSQTNDTNLVIDLFSPFLAERTSMTTQSAQGSYMIYGGGLDSNAASSTSFSLTPFAGTLTGGTIFVYGYGVS
jgi:hypothetical protein